ncbi:MAG: hypothetical protein ACI80V_002546 [Rhodothermales bacterium]|jgi:hypothetical protein
MHKPTSPLFLILVPVVAALLLAATYRSTDLPRAQSDLFAASGNCASCHLPDKPEEPALRDADGHDISPPTFWRSTMMANAAKDPFWLAKVSAEVAANPGLKEVIEDKCTTCHAPMGRTQALADGATKYSIEQMLQDPLALDGVSCTVCHQIQPGNLGTEASFSGGFEVGDQQTIFGPYTEPYAWPMLALSGYEPRFGEHMGSSALCATCHTLFTNSVDESGSVVGSLPEQTPYLEWLNSDYAAQGSECQGCHMPTESSAVAISNTPRGLDAREPFYRHEFVGGNAHMLTILRDNGTQLGVTADPVHFDSTIARTRRNLRSAAELSASARWDGDTLEVAIRVQNLSGHKLPTGYPSRRAWLDLALLRPDGSEAFRSGAFDPETGELTHLDQGFEPHQTVIRSEDQVQIYQSIMGNPAGEPVYGLLRASQYLKDNRIPPTGWTSTGPWYDETQPRGMAREDADFNASTMGEGTGADVVVYRVGVPRGAYQLDVRFRYQSLAPRFVADLRTYQTDAVDRFGGMYDRVRNAPELMDSLRLDIGTSLASDAFPRPESVPGGGNEGPVVYPNPASSHVTIMGESGPLEVYNILGQRIRVLRDGSGWDLTDQSGRRVAPGLYFISERSMRGGLRTTPISVVR